MNMSKAIARSLQSPQPVAAPRPLADTAVAEVLEGHDSAPDGIARMDPEARQEMIATAAYFIAEQRGFIPGHELADWCAAEAAVDASLLTASRRV